MIRFKIEAGNIWTIDDFISEIGNPERERLSRMWTSQTVNEVRLGRPKGFLDVVMVMCSHRPKNPLDNVFSKYVYKAINQELAPEKHNIIETFTSRNFIVPSSQDECVEILIYEETDKR